MTKNTRTHKCQYSTWYIYYINMMILVNNEWMPYNFFYTYDMIVNFCAIHKIILVVTRMMRKQVIHTTFVLETIAYYLCVFFFSYINIIILIIRDCTQWKFYLGKICTRIIMKIFLKEVFWGLNQRQFYLKKKFPLWWRAIIRGE